MMLVYLILYANGRKVAEIAQLVEQRIRNAKVGGSIPLFGTNVIWAFLPTVLAV